MPLSCLIPSQIDLWHVPHGMGDHNLLNHVSDGEDKENEGTPRPVAAKDKVVDLVEAGGGGAF